MGSKGREERPPEVGDRLPWPAVTAADGRELRFHQARSSRVAVFAHHDCRACVDYLRDVERVGPELSTWAAEPVAILDEPVDGLDVRQVVDEDADMRAAIGLTPGEVAVVVADRYGVIWDVDVAEGHDLPGTDALIERATHLGIQCPECETLDSPVYGVWDDASDMGRISR